jgi:hypothetical protein
MQTDDTLIDTVDFDMLDVLLAHVEAAVDSVDKNRLKELLTDIHREAALIREENAA